MYVAVRRYEGVSEPQKVAQLVDEGFIPIISEMPGFVAYYFGDAGDGVMVSTSVFEHKDAEEQINGLEYAINNEDDPLAGARRWASENRDVVRLWIEAARNAQ